VSILVSLSCPNSLSRESRGPQMWVCPRGACCSLSFFLAPTLSRYICGCVPVESVDLCLSFLPRLSLKSRGPNVWMCMCGVCRSLSLFLALILSRYLSGESGQERETGINTLHKDTPTYVGPGSRERVGARPAHSRERVGARKISRGK